MTREEFSELVEYVEDRFGYAGMDAWTVKVYPDFEKLPSDVVWEALLAKLDSDPSAQFPPKPPALRAAALERLRHAPKPTALPSGAEEYGWAEFCRRKYGEVRSLVDVVAERAKS